MSQVPKDVVIFHRYGDESHFLAVSKRVCAHLVCDPLFMVGQAVKRKDKLGTVFARLWSILRGYIHHPQASVYIYGFPPESTYFVLLCLFWWRRGRRVLFTSYSVPVETLRSPMRLLVKTNLRFASLFFDVAGVVSLSAERNLSKHLPTVLVEHAIDVDSYIRTAKRQGLIYLGRPAPYKNVNQIIDAAKATDFELDLVGPFKMDPRQVGEDLTSFRCLGPQSKCWIKRNLGKYRALILASDAFEPFGIVLLEAMAAGVLIVATRTYGTETIFRSWPEYPLLYNVDEGVDGLKGALFHLRNLKLEEERRLRGRLIEMAEKYRPEVRATLWEGLLD